MERAEQRVTCPYCGEPLTLLLDDSDLGQDYIEDCQVCCRPMVVNLLDYGDGHAVAQVRREDE